MTARTRAGEIVRLGTGWAVAIGVAIGALVVYRMTMLPGLGAWDTGEAQTVPTILGTMHPTGFPGYVVLGFLVTKILAPFAAAATIMNFLSAMLVSLAVGASILVSRRLGAPPILGAAVAIAFALTPIVWAIALAADAHALHIALVVGVTLGLLRWESLVRAWRRAPADMALRRGADRTIVATAALFGVALANHGLSLLLIPPIGLFVLATDPRVLLRPRLVVVALAACLGVAVLLYLQLPLRAGPFRAPLVYGAPNTWNGFWEIVTARQFQGDVAGPFANLAAKLQALLTLATAQFGPLIALIPAGLLVTAVRYPRYALFSGTAVLITCFFAAAYANANIGRYYLGPVFFAWTWIAAFGGAIAQRILEPGLADDEPPSATDAAPVPGFEPDGAPITRPAARPAWLAGLGTAVLVPAILGAALLVPTATQVRDRWSKADLSRVTWVHDWLDQAFDAMDHDAVVISWWSYSTPLWYGQFVEGRRPDIWVVDDRTRIDEDLGEVRDVIEANLGIRPVYVIRLQEAEVQALTDSYTIEPVDHPGNVFRVTGRQESSP